MRFAQCCYAPGASCAKYRTPPPGFMRKSAQMQHKARTGPIRSARPALNRQRRQRHAPPLGQQHIIGAACRGR